MKMISRLALKIFSNSLYSAAGTYRHERPVGDLRDFVERHYGSDHRSSKADGFFEKLRRKERAMEEQAKEIKGEQENVQEGAEFMNEMKQLRKDLDSLKGDLRDLTKSVRNLGSARVGDAKARLWGAATDMENRAEETLRGAYDSVRDQAQKAVDAGREQIQQHPMTSALWIFAAGFLVGKLVDRR